MGSLTLVLSILAVVFIVSTNAQQKSCPMPSKVYSCSPKCIEQYECTGGRVCCPNNCNTKSCVEPSAYGSGSSGDKYNKQSGGAGTYCNNVKCNSFEVCKLDPSTKRMKCQRS